MKLLLLLTLIFTAENSHAWGRRGHSVVCQTAAYLIAEEVKDNFYKSHSYDLGYYCNTPDFVWKEPATYNKEKTQHYMDKEIFDRGLKNHIGADPYAMSREDFDAKFPSVPQDAGRGFWRVREIYDLLMLTSEKLMMKNLTQTERFGHQANWLLLGGAIGHYIGDFSQPLHVTENHDGQLTKQKGIHSFFEDATVDELYGELEAEVLAQAKSKWKEFHKKNASVPLLDLMKQETARSYAKLGELLEIEKDVGRDLKKSKDAYQELIEERLVDGALYLAEILVRHTAWKPDNVKFFNFFGRPNYIELGKEAALPFVPTGTPAPEPTATPKKR